MCFPQGNENPLLCSCGRENTWVSLLSFILGTYLLLKGLCTMPTGQNPKLTGKQTRKPTQAATNLHALLGTGILSKGNISAAGTDTLPESRIEVKDVQQKTLQPPPLESQEKKIYSIALDYLLDNPYQPREDIPVDDDLREMAEGIKAHGLLGA